MKKLHSFKITIVVLPDILYLDSLLRVADEVEQTKRLEDLIGN